MNRRFYLFLLLPLILVAFQQADLVFVKSIPVKAQSITTDNFSNIYLVDNDIIQKYDFSGKPLKSFSNKALGKITSVDATNPMKVLLFYRNFLQILFFDNTLSQNGEPVSIESLGYPQTQLACSSHNNGIWIYNQQNFELIRFSQDLNLVAQTGNLAQLLGVELNPNYMVQYNNLLFLNNPETGVLVFDVFGTYSRTIPLKSIQDFQFKEEELVYFKNGMLNSFNMKTLQESSSIIGDSAASAVRLSGNKIFILKKDTLQVYNTNK